MKTFKKYLTEAKMHKEKAVIKPAKWTGFGSAGIDIVFKNKTIRLPKNAVEGALAGRKITLDIDTDF